jgi:D-alanyl-D-alanine carboxypeptidase-like protein
VKLPTLGGSRASRRKGLMRFGTAPLALAVGVVAGGLVGFARQSLPESSVFRVPEVAVPRSPATKPVTPDTLLAWTPGGLPAGLGEQVQATRGVTHAVSVASGTAWLTSSFAEDGARVDAPPPGLAIPLEVAGARLADYAPFLSPADRALLPALARGEAVLGSTEATLRHLGPGSTLVFGSIRLRVAGILPDASIGAHEVFVSRGVARSLGVRTQRYLLIDPGPRTGRRTITSRIRARLPKGLPMRVRGPGETPFFRQGDAVLPPVQLKEWFGEFAARPVGGYLSVDPAWVKTHITRAEVPILGHVRCNRALIPQLRGALQEIEREDLSRAIDPKQYAGCYSARFLNRNPESGISHHAWGVALDINVSRNPFGGTPHQNQRVVEIFERWGFTWGGEWLVPDGMHFEFRDFPTV